MRKTGNNNVNPFYVPAQAPAKVSGSDDEDEWGWGEEDEDNNIVDNGWDDDTDDLEELLGDGETGQRSELIKGKKSYDAYGRRPTSSSGSCLKYVCYFVILIGVLAIFTGYQGESFQSSSGNLKESKLNPNDTIVILGERHCGVDWLEGQISGCFPDATVSTKLDRDSFLFQDPQQNYPNVHAVLVTRNPYDWVEAMRLEPQYMPYHQNMAWDEFLETPWTSPNNEQLEGDEFPPDSENGRVCQRGFNISKVVSCAELTNEEETNPIYEMDQATGEPFDSILKLRTAKFLNFFDQVKPNVHTTSVVKHEDLVRFVDKRRTKEPGIILILDQLVQAGFTKVDCDLTVMEEDYSNGTNPQLVTFIDQKLDWTVEKKLGYKRLPSKKISNTADNGSRSSGGDVVSVAPTPMEAGDSPIKPKPAPEPVPTLLPTKTPASTAAPESTPAPVENPTESPTKPSPKKPAPKGSVPKKTVPESTPTPEATPKKPVSKKSIPTPAPTKSPIELDNFPNATFLNQTVAPIAMKPEPEQEPESPTEAPKAAQSVRAKPKAKPAPAKSKTKGKTGTVR